MLIGYASKKLQKICEEARTARKALPQDAAALLPQRLGQLAAFRCLEDVPEATPFFRHRLTANLAGYYSVRIDKKFRIIFNPVCEFDVLPDGTPDLKTVTAIEIASVENYHDG